MNSIKLAVVVALLAGSTALGQSVVSYELNLGGDNGVARWEDPTGPPFENPRYVAGSPADTTAVDAGTVLTWDAVITVTGTHEIDATPMWLTNGVANLVFSLELHHYVDGPGCTDLVTATTVTFLSTMNDGDSDGGVRTDPLEMAAFTHIYNVNGAGPEAGAGPGRIWDLVTGGGPHLSRAQFPSTSTHSGGRMVGEAHQLAGGIAAATTADNVLSGMGAGYTAFAPFVETAGVGIAPPSDVGASCLRGLSDVAVPIAEGQIDTTGLAAGKYCLVLVPGNTNILRGDFNCQFAPPDNPFGMPANSVLGDDIVFEINPGEECDAVVDSVATWKTHANGPWPVDGVHLDLVGGDAIPDTWLVTESRTTFNDPPLQIVITFSSDVGSLAGAVGGGGLTVDTQTLSGDGLTLTLDVSGAANFNSYTIDLSAALPDCPAGSELIIVRQCEGNTNGDNTTSGTDKAQVAAANGTVTDAASAFMDVQLDGTVTGTDKANVGALNGNPCPAP